MADNKDKLNEKIFKGSIDEARIKAKEFRNQQKKDTKSKENTVRGTGTHFEIKDREGSSITLDSDVKVKVDIKYAQKRSALHIERSHEKETEEPSQDTDLDSLPSSTQITISALQPNTIYHKYEDHYYNHIEITTNAQGNITYTQDISKPHVVFCKLNHPLTILQKMVGKIIIQLALILILVLGIR